jgi:hypothetical protein
VGDRARAPKQLECSVGVASLLADHREEVVPLGVAGKVLEEVVAERLRGIEATVDKLVEDVIGPIVDLIDLVVVLVPAARVAYGSGVGRRDGFDDARSALRDKTALLVLLPALGNAGFFNLASLWK